jgi:arylsulfatase
MARTTPTFVVTAFLGMACLSLPVMAQATTDKPNVVIMLADNLGYGDLGAYGAGDVRGMPTPRIDELATEGLRMTQFLVEPGCTPSRAGLMTGRYSIRSGLSLIIAPGAGGGLQAKEVTLGELFKSVGYDTAYFGKWHLGAKKKSQPQNQGFDQWRVGFFGSTDGSLYGETMVQSKAPAALRKAISVNIVEADGPGAPLKIIRPYDRKYRRVIEKDISSAAVEFIKSKSKSGKPFFAFIGWTRPHFPNDSAPEFTGKSRIGKYGDSIMELDHRTGEILDALNSVGVKNKTIVVWISDNGPTTTGTNRDELNVGSAGPFSGELGDAREGSIRTAGIVRWPNKIKPGVSNEMVSIHDFFPTLAKIIGANVPSDRPIDGVDQSAFFLGNQTTSNRQHLLTFIGDRLAAVRWRQWRLYPMTFSSTDGNPKIGGYVGRFGETAGFPEAYNIEADQREQHNVVHENGWILAPYLQVIGAYLKTLKKHPNPPAGNLTKF